MVRWIKKKKKNTKTLINFLVECPQGIIFMKSIDPLNIMKNATNLFHLFDEIFEWVNPSDVVHMVTNNATNYIVVGSMIFEKYKHINWSPCPSHCLNLNIERY